MNSKGEKMRAHYLQHVPFEGLGSIEPWLMTAGYEITNTRLFEAGKLPGVDEKIDLLIVMGGPMSVNDENEFPWLPEEKRFVRNAVENGKPVLGICLGAQLIASAMGAKVFPNALKEIGWYPIEGASPADSAVFGFPPSIEVFHWHGETFGLPPGATLLASSSACENQAFQLGDSVIGMQFHLETTPASARALVSNCGDELVEGEYIQTAQDILSAPQERYGKINSLMSDILEYLHKRRHQAT